MKSIASLMIVLSCTYNALAQTVHRYGADLNFHYHTRDIIRTADGNFVLLTDGGNNGSFTYYSTVRRALIKIDGTGGLIFEELHSYSRGLGYCMEQSNGDLLTFGTKEGPYTCNFVNSAYPFRDGGMTLYSNTGIRGTSFTYDKGCTDGLVHPKKLENGNLLSLYKADNPPIINVDSIYIVEVDDNAHVSFVHLPPGVSRGVGYVEKSDSGYWLLEDNRFCRLDAQGNIISQDTLLDYQNLTYFTKVEQDSLLMARSHTLTKYDSTGKESWTHHYGLEIRHIYPHSSGNYLLTGPSNTGTKVMLVSPTGDSLWSRVHPESSYSSNYIAYPVKTIEGDYNKIVTLIAETALSSGRCQAVVIIDSLYSVTTVNTTALASQEATLHCYPNPSNSQVQIDIQEAPNHHYQVSLTSLLGQRVLQQSQSTASFSLGVEQLPKGLYLLTITSSSGAVFEEKLVVGE